VEWRDPMMTGRDAGPATGQDKPPAAKKV